MKRLVLTMIAMAAVTASAQTSDYEWEVFTKALISVESNDNPKAVNPTSGAVGLFQILPLEHRLAGYLHDWNAHNAKQYTTADLFEPEVQWLIFNWHTNRYNKNRDIPKAIKLHNPKAGEWYADRIYLKMQSIVESE
ncbi:MAG: transglycosylase SLT domain-containing protein [Rikenellaceae bacterium]